MKSEQYNNLCNSCVAKYNQMLGDPFPCNVCINYSEYIEISDDDPYEGGWMEDQAVCARIIDIIDEILDRLNLLDVVLPSSHITTRCRPTIDVLEVTKKAMIEYYIFDPTNGNAGEPCYDMVNCPDCNKETCAYRRQESQNKQSS